MNALRVVAIAFALVAAEAANAEPTVWRATASPRARAESEALHELDVLVGKSRSVVDLSPTRRDLALHFLEKAGAETSSSPVIALLYGDLLRVRGDRETALPYLSLAVEDGPMLRRVDALSSLGFTFARLARPIEEAAAFEYALEFSVDAWERSNLLANQAEAFMAAGDLRRAVAGYRASLECLRGPELMMAVTTFWGLAVALDRSGDTREALHSIAIARQYDPMDRALGDEGWSFVPDYEEGWYRALGALGRARSSADPAERVAAYRTAIDGYTDFLKRSPADGPYAAIARARIDVLESEALTVPTPEPTASL